MAGGLWEAHRWNAIKTSAYKYGKSLWFSKRSLWQTLRWREIKAWERDGNAEHIVNIINYDMFMWEYDDNEKAKEDAEKWKSRYVEEDYKGTDSDCSVTKGRGQRVSEWLRQGLLQELGVW